MHKPPSHFYPILVGGGGNRRILRHMVNFPHAVLKSIDKGSFIDMLKTAGAGDSERTNRTARTTIVRTY